MLDAEPRRLLKAVNELVMQHVILRPAAQMVEYREPHVAQEISTTLAADPQRFLDRGYLRTWCDAPDARSQLRAVCDYMASMTDEFVPRARTAFEPDQRCKGETT